MIRETIKTERVKRAKKIPRAARIEKRVPKAEKRSIVRTKKYHRYRLSSFNRREETVYNNIDDVKKALESANVDFDRLFP
jgi:hypothetical protein